MYQGTTPSIVFTINGYDLTTATVYVSFKYGNEVLTKVSPTVQVSYDSEKSTIVCPLTQEETLAITKSSAVAQIRFIYENGLAYATNKAEINVESVIYKEVIEYGGAT
jgi:hypothetical protein